MFSDEAAVRHFPICERKQGRFIKNIQSARLAGSGYTRDPVASTKSASSKRSISNSLSKAIYGLKAARTNSIRRL